MFGKREMSHRIFFFPSNGTVMVFDKLWVPSSITGDNIAGDKNGCTDSRFSLGVCFLCCYDILHFLISATDHSS